MRDERKREEEQEEQEETESAYRNLAPWSQVLPTTVTYPVT